MNRTYFINYIISAIFSVVLFSCNSVESPYPSAVWEAKNNFPTGLSSASGCSANGKGYVFFGRTSMSKDTAYYANNCYEYNPTTDKWKEKTPCPGFRRVKGIAVEMGGKIYAGLGYRGVDNNMFDENNYLKDFWLYDPATDEWTQKKDFPNAQTSAASAFVNNGKIYVVGGFWGTSFDSRLWQYNPATDEWTEKCTFPAPKRAAGITVLSENQIFYGTGFQLYSWNDWWQYIPESDTWEEVKRMPDTGRTTAVGLSCNGRFFVATGRHFRGSKTGGHLKADLIEYDAKQNNWYNRGDMPTKGRENAVAFTIDGKGYIGLGETDDELLYDLWSFEP